MEKKKYYLWRILAWIAVGFVISGLEGAWHVSMIHGFTLEFLGFVNLYLIFSILSDFMKD